MQLNDWGKLLVLLSCVLTTAVLAALHVLDSADVRVTIAAVLGYVTGNGVLARRRQAPSTVLAPTLHQQPSAVSDGDQ